MAKILLALTELIVNNIWILFIAVFLFGLLIRGLLFRKLGYSFLISLIPVYSSYLYYKKVWNGFAFLRGIVLLVAVALSARWIFAIWVTVIISGAFGATLTEIFASFTWEHWAIMAFSSLSLFLAFIHGYRMSSRLVKGFGEDSSYAWGLTLCPFFIIPLAFGKRGYLGGTEQEEAVADETVDL